jgi:hypothetical protein
MKTVALADETEIVCSFIFKNVWRENNLDKICGPRSSQMSRVHFEQAKSVAGKGRPQISERCFVEGLFRKLEKADLPFLHPSIASRVALAQGVPVSMRAPSNFAVRDF